MSKFFDWIEHRIREDVAFQLSQVGGGNFRSVFLGFPEQILKQILKRLAPDQFMKVEIRGKEEQIVVLLLSATANNPETIGSGQCTQGYLVKARNGSIMRLLVLLPPDTAPIISILTTFTKFGVSPDRLANSQAWVDDSFVHAVLMDAIGYRNVINSGDEIPEWVLQVMSELASLEHINKLTSMKWTVVRRLFDQYTPKIENGSQLVVFAATGLVKPSNFTSNHLDLLKLAREIGGYFEREGFVNGFTELKECVYQLPSNEYEIDVIDNALDEFEKHVFYVAGSAPEFASATLRYYCPYEDGDFESDIPDWWHVLDASTWRSLLECKSVARSCISVNVENNLVQESTKGIPAVTSSDVLFQIDSADNATIRPSITINRRVGRQQPETIGSIESGIGSVTFCDENVPSHLRQLTYEFEPSDSTCKSTSVKVIALSSFEPGFVAISRGAERATLPKPAKSGDHDIAFECDLELDGQGIHQIELLTSREFKIKDKVFGYGVTTDSDDESGRSVMPVQALSGRWIFDALTDEECRYEFSYDTLESSSIRARINLRAGDVEPVGASSEFHRLILKVSRGQNAKVSLQENQHIHTLQRWMLEKKFSFNPLLLSPSYGDQFGNKPDWSSRPICSVHMPVYDPRPDSTEFKPPTDLVEIRHAIAQMIASDQEAGICERAQLGKLYKHDSEFKHLVNKYLDGYVEWQRENYESAAWFDTVIVCFYQRESEMLDPVPVAVLLSPLHPIRLGWQVVAQYLLFDAVDRDVRCPGVSVFDPSGLPDALAFPIVNASGTTKLVPFVSIPCNSDYWSVLWNLSELSKVSGTQAKRLFTDKFGISLSGLSTGISMTQVKRGMQEVFSVSPGRSRLRVRLLSDLEVKSETNDGVSEWAHENIGDKDPWSSAARISLDVLDSRDSQQQPTEPFVANLIQRTRGAARWIIEKENHQSRVDLSIVANLKQTTMDGSENYNAYSAISCGALTRERLRYRISRPTTRFVGETRSLTDDGLELVSLDKIVDKLASSVELIDLCFESAMVEHCSFGGISFAPNIPTLEKGLKSSSYCAVSSTDIDFSVFLQPQFGSYLWDYDLPSYASKAQDNVGYYLMAQHSTEIEKQVEQALKLLGGTNFHDEFIRDLLSEISSRGLPSLKVLASGGSAAIGEIGVLVTCRLLQGQIESQDELPNLLPFVCDEGRVLNLLLPVDPFAAQIDDFRRTKGLKTNDFRRPDLLVVSFRLDDNGNPLALRLTPVEVKTRSGSLDAKARRSALDQASSFASFLKLLLDKRNEEPIWNLVVSKFFAAWFSFGFRVYGEKIPSKFHDKLIASNAAINQAILRGQLEFDVDLRGRLVVISNASTLRPLDLDNDGLEETISIQSNDALGIITSPTNSSVLKGLVEELNHWDLVCPQIKEEKRDSENPNLKIILEHLVPPSHKVSTPSNSFPPTGTDRRPPSVKTQATGGKRSKEIEEYVAESSPANPQGVCFDVGSTLDLFKKESRNYFPGNTQLTQLNVGIVGNLGTGKTQLTKSIVYQVIQSQKSNFGQKPFFLIFDYKRDYSDPEFVNALGAKLIRPRRMPINIFDTSTVISESPAWLERSNFLYDVLDKIYSGMGPVQKERLKESVKNAYRSARIRDQADPTLIDVFNEYRERVNNPDAVYSILSDMVDMELFEEDVSKILPFSEYLDGVVIVDLAALGQNDETKNILVVLFLNLFYENMLKLEKHPFVGTNPQLRTINGFLLVDEADNIMRYQFPVLQKVLLQGREFGVGVLLASQYLSHFKPDARTNYKEPLLTWFIHQVPDVTVNELKAIGLAEVDNGITSRIQALRQHECLYKSLNVNGEFIQGIPYYVLRDTD